jgi:hypothetical protein
MASRIDSALRIEGYVRAGAYSERIIREAVREYKPEPERIIDNLAVLPLRIGRQEIGELIEFGSAAEIADALLRGRFMPWECDYRTSADSCNIPEFLQLALVKRFVEIAECERKTRESGPNKVGLVFFVATAVGAIVGILGDGGFGAGIASTVIAACCASRAKERKISRNAGLARELLASERLTSTDARGILSEFCITE